MSGNKEGRMSMLCIVWKAAKLGVKVKTPLTFAVAVLSIPAALLPLGLSKQLQQLTDQLMDLVMHPNAEVKDVYMSMLMLGAFFLCIQGFQFLSSYCRVSDQYRTRTLIKEIILRHVCTVHYSYIENRDDFYKRIEFADTYAADEMSRSIQGMFDILCEFVTLISIGISLWVVHPAIVCVLVATSVPAAILSYKQSDETFRYRTKWMEEGRLNVLYYQFCCAADHGIQELRHYDLYDHLKACWKEIAKTFVAKKKSMTAKHLRVNLIADVLHSAVYLVILLITAKQIYQNPLLGLGVFSLVYTLSDKLQKSIGSVLTQAMQYSAGMAYLQEFFGLDDLEHEACDEPLQYGRGAGEIEFDHVFFAYPGSEDTVLKDLSVKIKAGQKVAIVGNNGSGKTTFISLLVGLFSPQKGKVVIDGLLMENNKQKLRKDISVVFQDFAHYAGTLRENIVVSDENRKGTDAEILDLARAIHVEDIIEEQTDGLDTLLGRASAGGKDLSGGQWQKIALLRAVYRSNTSIIVLDEPTAALDPMAEAELYRDFTQITDERTTLLISHRLGATKLVDRILVFDNGRIVEDGTHQQLMEQKGRYYEMYSAQAEWYQEEEASM